MEKFDLNYVKNAIEKIRVSTKVIKEMDDLDIFKDGLFDNAVGPIYDVTYSLLKSVYDLSGIDEDKDDVIFQEFSNYLSGKKYDSIDDFINWLKEV